MGIKGSVRALKPYVFYVNISEVLYRKTVGKYNCIFAQYVAVRSYEHILTLRSSAPKKSMVNKDNKII